MDILHAPRTYTGAKDKVGTTRPEMHGRILFKSSLAALGIVFGDIGTSPLYALRECFHGKYGIPLTTGNIFGVLSLMFWAMIMIVTFKYLTIVFQADNNGEGGVIALTALLKHADTHSKKHSSFLIAIGLFAACLLYGDGMITPGISVLSAVEGIQSITPALTPYIIPLTIVVLSGLFLLQRHGTSRVGSLFGPVVLLWFLVIAILGAVQIVRYPGILQAVLPWDGLIFLIRNKLHGTVALGGVFLVVTGAEALYADMGHFGKRPIRLTWLVLVFPALVLNYFGQGALLLTNQEASHNPFYALVPPWALVPMVLLATAATIIASQAVITGSFSLTRQAIQLGYLPRMRVSHTSARHIGQIYIAPVNWLLMICTIGLVIGFRSSSNLAAAYGVAVTSTMLITTTLFFVVARQRWGWNLLAAGTLTAVFFLVDIPFFCANISKIRHGAWFPLMVGGIFFILMLTWDKGRKILAEQCQSLLPTIHDFRTKIQIDPPQRVNGQAVFLTGNPERIPLALVKNLNHNKILHADIIILHVATEDVPRVPNLKKIDAQKLGSGLYRIIAHYGFMEMPKIKNILALAREQGVDVKLGTASFFLGREKLGIGESPKMSRWRTNLFLFLSKNAMDASSFFDIPSDQVIEVGVQLQL